jgi:pimeloyl-ACP methyl ester carboxylesterase
MGGGIVATFADKFGKAKINSLTYLAGAGLDSMSLSVPSWRQDLVNVLTDLPFGFRLGLGLIWKALLEAPLKNPSRMWTSDNTDAHDFYQSYFQKRVQNEPGLSHAALTTVKYYPFQKLGGAFRGVASQEIRTMAVWGTADKLVPVQCAADLRVAFDQAGCGDLLTEEVLDGFGHSFTIECYEKTAELLLKFWKSD